MLRVEETCAEDRQTLEYIYCCRRANNHRSSLFDQFAKNNIRIGEHMYELLRENFSKINLHLVKIYLANNVDT